MPSHQIASHSDEMFRPPVNRAMRVLDRTFFKKRIPLAAARVLKKKEISSCRTKLGNDMLRLERMSSVVSDTRTKDVENDSKSILLGPGVRYNGIDYVNVSTCTSGTKIID